MHDRYNVNKGDGGFAAALGIVVCILFFVFLWGLSVSPSVISNTTVQVQVETEQIRGYHDPSHVIRVGTKTYPLPFDVKCDFENGSPIEAIRVVYSDGSIKYNVTKTERNRFLVENCK